MKARYPQPDGSKGGSVSAFQRDAASGKLTDKNIVPAGAPVPATSRSIVPAGRICRELQQRHAGFVSHHAQGLKAPSRSCRARQRPEQRAAKGPHLHCTTLSPDERFLW